MKKANSNSRADSSIRCPSIVRIDTEVTSVRRGIKWADPKPFIKRRFNMIKENEKHQKGHRSSIQSRKKNDESSAKKYGGSSSTDTKVAIHCTCPWPSCGIRWRRSSPIKASAASEGPAVVPTSNEWCKLSHLDSSIGLRSNHSSYKLESLGFG